MRDFTASGAHVRAARKVIPGGAHTYAKGDDQYPEGMAPVIARGDGCRVWDVDGNEYVEFGSGLRANVLGHGFEPLLERVRAALADGIGFVRPHYRELEAATRLAELIPSAEMVKFGLNGSDATTAALRLARAYTGRDMVAICRDHPFFSTDDWFIGTTAMSAGIPAAAKRLSLHFSYNDLPGLAGLFGEYPGQIAAVILEPETVTPPADGFFAGLRDLCDRHGALLILDEMITGFRWHERGAQYLYGIEPDLSTFGKALANGFPLSALTGRGEVMRLGGFTEDADRVFLLSQTAGAQPWALAAMMAVIDTFQRDQVAARLLEIGAELRAGVEEVVADAGLSEYFQLRGRDCNLVYTARDAQGQASQQFRTLVLQELLERGVLAPSFVVSAAHDPAAIKQTVAAVAELMPAYRQALDHGVDTVLRGRPVRPANRSRGLPRGGERTWPSRKPGRACTRSTGRACTSITPSRRLPASTRWSGRKARSRPRRPRPTQARYGSDSPRTGIRYRKRPCPAPPGTCARRSAGSPTPSTSGSTTSRPSGWRSS
jgi:glutamate-1-semialdehyde 2,1-aminomutase